MQAIYDKANELADLILNSEAYRNIRAAEKKVEGNAEVKKIVEEYNRVAGKIAQKERELKPIEPDEKHEMLRVREQMQSNLLLQELLKAQTEYAMMMNRINTILMSKLERKEG